ncbi:DNA repair protein complementing XP-C cells homolog [Oppia nitens]|uniref:DNA repair protein complementing XP-C cells homolog n=1 Tax=Oppia nitens TaxID=1686743 RepID=UPI0023DAECF3|nr:DNA repair protein complementing XP-C cells homolog [Oppia nitens]
MAPKKSYTRSKTKSKESSITSSNQTNTGLRRSSRTSSKSLTKSTAKSVYFDDESDVEDMDAISDIIDDVDDEYDEQEFTPKKSKRETKRKRNVKKNSKRVVKTAINSQEDNSDSDDNADDWEEVKDDICLDDYNPEIPSEGVEITINGVEVKKNKKSIDINTLIRQRINGFKRRLQAMKHKTSLVCLIARIVYLNNVINDELIQAISLSIVVNQFKSCSQKLNSKFLNQFIDWFSKNFSVKYKKCDINDNIKDILCQCLEQRVAQNSSQLNMIFIALLRSLCQNYNLRLCYALNPVDIKPDDLILSENQMKLKKSSNCQSLDELKEKTKTKTKSKKRKVEDNDCNDNEMVTNLSLDLWCEAYVESERKWICLDLFNNFVDKPTDISSKSLSQLTYVIAIDSDGYLREVTQRYSSDWMSANYKRRRIDDNWWSQTLLFFERKTKSCAEKSEDLEFKEMTSTTPLPTKVSDFKNHPLYVLKRDLLKFQGIYPSDAPPLGFIKDEAVYARECVHLLRSRDSWPRNARTVRTNETPYKIVTSRPKWDKYAKVFRKDLPLEVFGEWQTDPYTPPEAKDGLVPRNSFGNVDLFQPSMLPKGCVYLQLPGLLRIANKLKIDCAQAIVGFDNNLGCQGVHPKMDGYVVCQEFKDILIDAWDEEQDISRKREIKKKEKRVYDNWKKLIKGLLIRENVKQKFKYNE